MTVGEKLKEAPAEQTLAAHRALSDASRVGILNELRRAEAPLDAAELAQRTGLHHNTVRSHLGVLLKAGLISGEAQRREAPGRPRVVYRAAAARTPAEESGGFRLLAHILASYLSASGPDAEAAAIEAGRAWGRYLVERPAPFVKVSVEEALERIMRLLDQLGFAPELVAEGEPRIHLHRCPFQDLAVAHPEITCPVHLGLIQGGLAEMDAPVDGTRLDRFVKPSLCIAHFVDRAGRQTASRRAGGRDGVLRDGPLEDGR